ncbi:dihydrodipicolinate synthase family protein [Egicoccus sp. AB-alg6-2]|uniref:dihydrodipicolinate synthase family protein n=1 Tax=Egicoccus sp. AB-alg6-2 TaxID=3242692 RepID=UPI00359E91FB
MRLTGLHGAMVALVTPLDEGREVHLGDVEVLVRRAVGDGATGVVLAGTTGEGALLEPAQRETLTRTTRATVDGLVTTDAGPRPLVVAGASGATVPAVEEDVERLAAAGADAVLVLAPHTYPLTSEELTAYHLEVAQRTSVPMLVYHIPQLTGSSLEPAALPELATHPRIVGMKDSSPDADRRAAFAAEVADQDAFALLTGHGPSLAAALRAGVDGSITAIANLRLRQVVALHAAVGAGDDAEASRLQASITRTVEAIGAVAASTPAVLKAALQLDGLVTERWCRPPLHSIPPARLDHVRSALLR